MKVNDVKFIKFLKIKTIIKKKKKIIICTQTNKQKQICLEGGVVAWVNVLCTGVLHSQKFIRKVGTGLCVAETDKWARSNRDGRRERWRCGGRKDGRMDGATGRRADCGQNEEVEK